METLIKIKFPLKRMPKQDARFTQFLPLWKRLLFPIYCWGGGSVQEFAGSRVNRVIHIQLFRWHLLSIHRNEYVNKSDAERADEYLRKWSECDAELRMFRLAALGPEHTDEVKKVIRESLGVDIDEGTLL